MAKAKYPMWKKLAWRFGRVFVSALLMSLASGVSSIASLADLWPALVLPALIAGASALAKAVREWLASGDYRSLWHKLPV